MSNHILGLDLGTTSIGFAHVIENENPSLSEIKQIGVRVNPLTTDEQTNFEKGKPLSVNATRTLKRGARRNLDRYQLRRKNLIDVLQKANIITAEAILAEDGKNTTHETWRLRAKAVTKKLEKEQLARVFLAINKKRGYKTSRKAKNPEEGQAVDGMAIAKRLYEENLTPGQLVYQLLKEGKKTVPDFYRSDLEAEFNKVWETQKRFYPKILSNELKQNLHNKNKTQTWAICKEPFDIVGIKRTTKGKDQVIENYGWRNSALLEQLSLEQLAIVLQEINNQLGKTSGYLGEISDRSKELYFNKETVGQNQYRQLQQNPHCRLKNQVFYRQDYMDEFETIWIEQAKHHPELTPPLKTEIRDITIFYQRKLKSQKSLVSFCEFENKEIEVEGKKKTVGLKVAPKPSPLFQEFKIWQRLNDVLIRKKGSKKRTAKQNDPSKIFEKEEKEVFALNLETKQQLFEELNMKGNLSATKIIELLGQKPSDWEMNFSELEGNRTQAALYNAYLKILEVEGYDGDLLKLGDKGEVDIADLKIPASEIKTMVQQVFENLGISTAILDFDAELDGKAFQQQASYQLWHLLYSAEDDSQKYSDDDILVYGNDDIGLKKQLCDKFSFKPEHAKILANVVFSDDYGSLSSKAMRKIMPHIKENNYNTACELAGYRHSAASFLTKEEIASRPLKDNLDLLKKNSLRNPVVEKILNQMVNVVNALIEKNRKNDPTFRFNEIRVELARELKKNAKERAEMTNNINAAKSFHEKIVKILQAEFGVKNPTRNDIIRYKLYEELKNNGYKDLYTDTYIPKEILFSKQLDVDHIIPQAKLFDDSFSNKVVVYRKDNLEKGNRTAFDYIESKYGEAALQVYLQKVENLFEQGKKSKDDPTAGISKAKYQKLLKKELDIGDGFIERDLRDSQYIAKKAKNMLYDITRTVVATSGSITDRLREDWDLINVMKELNLPKYRALGMTEIEERKFGKQVEVINDWTKRNDHRHHAMDALVVAFTKQSHIQYLNHLNARRDETMKWHPVVSKIEVKDLHKEMDDDGNYKWVFNEPILNFRHLAKEHLEKVLVSHKAKNKVVTKNKNKTKSKNGGRVKTELTPRGQLHKETVYGKYHYYETKEEKVSAKFDKATIEKVANPAYKKLLLHRLEQNGDDPKKAFAGKNSPGKNPIYLDGEKRESVPEKVQLVWLKEDYSIRKDVTPDNFKDEKSIGKILDKAVQNKLLARFEAHGGDAKKAFSDIEKNPIWLNEAKGICIKRVTISGVKNAESLRYQKDHFGNDILTENGHTIPADFVSSSENHHIAIYRDENGKLQDNVVSFFDAVRLGKSGEPIIDKAYNQGLGWQFVFSMKKNEYFVFPNEKTGFSPKEIDLLDSKSKKLISPNLFVVESISKVVYPAGIIRDFQFGHHLEAGKKSDRKDTTKGTTHLQFKSLSFLENIVKVRLNHLGEIVHVGE